MNNQFQMDLSSQSDESLSLDSLEKGFSEDDYTIEDNDDPYMNHDPETIDANQLRPESTVLLDNQAFKVKQEKLLRMKVCFCFFNIILYELMAFQPRKSILKRQPEYFLEESKKDEPPPSKKPRETTLKHYHAVIDKSGQCFFDGRHCLKDKVRCYTHCVN